MNLLSSALFSLVFLERSSDTSMLALLSILDWRRTVSRSLNVSKVTRTGRQPRTSGPVWMRVALSIGISRLLDDEDVSVNEASEVEE